jgi:hypothetical protein
MPAQELQFADLLHTAVTQPGILSDAYRAFQNYFLGKVYWKFAKTATDVLMRVRN